MDDFNTLSQRLLNRCPNAGIVLTQQFVNDAWQTLQARREWSFRRKHGTFAPPTLYNAGTVSTNVATGSPTLITGSGTTWTQNMVGRQIRAGGLLYPYYTIVGWLSATELLIDQPWAGPDISGQAYNILQCFFPVPDNFGYFYVLVSVKDGFRLWTNLTEADLGMLDPQRTNYGQTYAAAFYDYTPSFGGTIGPVIPVTSPTDPAPVSTTDAGFSYVANATYIVQVVNDGPVGISTYQWMRAGQTAFQPEVPTHLDPQTLADGVQIYWPEAPYVSRDLFVINCQSQVVQGSPRYELWPAPTFNGYLYPYIYIAKESNLTVQQPSLPPFIANRGEVLLEMALQKCAEFPGSDMTNPNIYYNLKQAGYHSDKVRDMLIDLERNDEEIGVTNIDFQAYPYAPSPWMDGNYQQTHAPFLNS